MNIGDASQFVLLLVFSWTLKVQATCPNVHGGMPVSRPLGQLDSPGVTGLNFENPITCNGFVTGWRFFPVRSEEFVALVFRPFKVSDHKYAVAGRTIIPAQQRLNQIREHKLQHSEWIPVLSGDVIGFKFENALLTYDDSTSSMFSFAHGVNKHEYMLGTVHVIGDGISYRTYSFQAVLQDSYLPCHIIKRPFMKPTTNIINQSRMWMDDWNKIKCPGTIIAWRFIASGPGDIIALVYRAVDADDSLYEVVGKTMIPSPAERDVVTEFKLTYSERIDVTPGDKLGFALTGDALYQQVDDSDAATVYKHKSRPNVIEVGDQIQFSDDKRFRRVTLDAILEEPTLVHQSKVILKDFKLQNHITESITSKRLATCVTKCLDDEDCQSVNYNQNHMTCDLNDATRDEDSVNFVAEAGGTYIETSRKLTMCIRDRIECYHE
ncbi:uncharacterized protein LOC117122760 [Anneissia japonica]|uniref:uncharacterized protein LOC117122760 n=1 Tax=Anneissia japonica TaxID=1529436 RepID=UPI001425AF1E|nr:uncharacterized protein LOC117122760 [Anneissia japonica]